MSVILSIVAVAVQYIAVWQIACPSKPGRAAVALLVCIGIEAAYLLTKHP